MINNLLLAACTAPTNSVTCFLGAGSNIWFPIILLTTLAIIAVIAVIYQLSPLLGRNDIKVWARAKIYDCFITIIFAIIFLSFSTIVLTTSPVSAFSSLGIVPNACNPSVSGNNPTSSNIADIYGLSDCEFYTFNQAAASFTQSMFVLAIIGGINPSATVSTPSPFPISPATGSGVGFSFQFQLFPIVIVHQYIVPYMQAYFTAVLVSQLLQIVLNSSAILFSIFMILGLIARSFGITKSFGGAMIAFGLGLGFIYPLMASLTYGFMDTAIQNAACVLSGTPTTTPQLTTCGASIGSMASVLFVGMLSVPINSIFNGLFSFASKLTPLVVYGGFVAAGLLLIPLLNLIVVDAFIVDFSKAIGERMDLFSLLTRML